MTLDQYNRLCAALPHTSHVVQWGEAHVWKVAGKVFAIGRPDGEGGEMAVSFKASRMSFDLLKISPACGPRPISPRAG